MAENIIEILRQAGLRKEELAVFQECQNNFPRASEIAENVKLKRTHVYAVIESLKLKGLIVEISNKKVKQFRAVSIARIYEYIERRQLEQTVKAKKFESILKTLGTSFDIRRRPEVVFYNGINEVNKLHLELSESYGNEQIKACSPFVLYAVAGSLIDEINNKLDRKYIRNPKEYIPERRISPDTAKTRSVIEFQTKKHPYYQKHRDIRLVSFDKFPLDSQFIIRENDISILTLTENESWAIRFYDRSMINTFNAIFEALWVQGKPYIN